MTIQAFYKNVLNSMGHQVLDDDLISFKDPEGKLKPTTVDGRRLVMPTAKRLRDGFDDELQPFHPLAESIARKGTSPVLQVLQRTARAVISHNTIEIARRLLEIAADKSLHADLPPTCSEYLIKLTDADKKMVRVFNSLVDAALMKNEFIIVYLKNGGKLQGKVMNRLCVIHFPFIEALEAGEDTIYGIKVRKKDRETLTALMHYVLPFGSDPEYYSAGSNSRMAPYFDALMRAYNNVATQLNKLIKRYATHIDLSLTKIDLSYMEQLENMKEYYDVIPSLRGNTGTPTPEEKEMEETSVNQSQGQSNQPTQSVQRPQPEVKPTAPPAQKAAPGTVSMSEVMAAMRPAQPAPYHQPVNSGYHQNHYQGYQPVNDPLRPEWLVGSQQPPVNSNPFAAALGLGATGQYAQSSPPPGPQYTNGGYQLV